MSPGSGLPRVPITNTTPMDRKDILLRAAYDIIKRSTMNHFVEETGAILAHYDGADCDGLCLMEDIAIELGLDDRESPIPLQGNA